jgi:hypothetical protein
MVHIGVERRRTPRLEPTRQHTSALKITVPVEVVDISLAGVQLACKTELAVGEHAALRATVGAKTLSMNVEICRVAPDTKPSRGGGRHRAGAVIADATAEQRVVLEQLLGTEP